MPALVRTCCSPCSSWAAVTSGCGELGRHRRQGLRRRQGHHHPLDRRRPQDSPGRSPGRRWTASRSPWPTTPGKVVVLNVWGSWCPPCRDEAPMLADGVPGTSRPTAWSSSGINTKDSSPDRAWPSSAATTCPTTRIYDPSGRTLLAFRGTLSPNAIPSTVVIDPQGRVAASMLGEVPSQQTLVDLVRDVGRTSDSSRPGRLVREHGLRRLAAARRPGGSGGRAGLVLLPVRGAAAAGLPLLRHRALRRRPRGRPSAAGCSPASLLFVLGFSFVFVSFGALIGGGRRVAVRATSGRSRRARRPDDPARAGVPRRGAVAAARLAGAPGAGGRARGGAAARRAVRAGLGAVHRARRWPR